MTPIVKTIINGVPFTSYHKGDDMGIIDNLSGSFKFANEALIGKWGRWILLIIGSFIFPLIMGYNLRVMKGGVTPPDSDHLGGMFIDGIKVFIIGIIYMIIPLIIGLILLFTSGGLDALSTIGSDPSKMSAETLSLIGTLGIAFLIFIIICFIFGLFEIIGIVRFARTGRMGAAFEIGEIAAKIGSIGWIRYIIALIVLFIVIFIINMILGFIPILGFILTIILLPYFSIVSSRYYALIYDTSE